MLPDGKTVGYIGEHNATILEITPPDYMLSDGVSLFCLAVETGREFIKVVVRSAMVPKASKINIPLWQQATGSQKAKLQLEAYDDGGNLIIKSPVAEVEFLPSVNGVQNVSDTNNASIVADIAANTAARHTHENAETLNKLGDSNGSLTYDGKAVGGRQTATVTLDIIEATPDSPTPSSTFIYLNNTNKVPDNAEIVSVELNAGTADSPVWIDLRDMSGLYIGNPYSLIYHKIQYSDTQGIYFLASIIFPLTDKNELITALDNYGIPQIRVTYYI